MYKLAQSSDSIIQIFTNLCLSQVKEQLTENLIYCSANPTSFICNGQLFSYIHNRSIIPDDSLIQYGVDVNYSHTFN